MGYVPPPIPVVHYRKTTIEETRSTVLILAGLILLALITGISMAGVGFIAVFRSLPF